MPTGIPVAGVGIGNSGAKNAAYLAVSILSLKDKEYKEKIKNTDLVGTTEEVLRLGRRKMKKVTILLFGFYC